MPDEYVLDENDKPKLDESGNPIIKTPDPSKGPSVDDELIAKLVQEGIDKALAPIKENLNSAYSARDEALKQVAEFEQQKKDAEIQRLKDEGQHKEAFEKEMAEAKAREAALEKRNTELTRDVELRSALSATKFRSENAAEMAFKEIAAQLVKGEDGNWVHKSGVAIKDFTNTFTADEANAFLLEQKPNTGTGSQQTKTTPVNVNEGKSLFSLPQSEVLKMAEEGKLPGRS